MGAQHTKGPWGVALDVDGFTNIVSPNADGTLELMIAECYGPQELQEANAAFIVEACNSHAALLAEREALREQLAQSDQDRCQAQVAEERFRTQVGSLSAALAEARQTLTTLKPHLSAALQGLAMLTTFAESGVIGRSIFDDEYRAAIEAIRPFTKYADDSAMAGRKDV